MPNLSDKGIYLPPSPIRKLVPFAEAAKRRGIKVYHLNIGQPDIRTPQVAVDAVKNIHDQVFEYGHSAGNESYRRKLADYYRGVGIDVTTDDMVITVGGSEAIFMAMTICLNPGDEVLVPEPFYANYNGFAMEAGVNIKPISSTIANDFALPPMEEFERLITTRTKAILICNPNNPTGYVYSEQEYEQLKNIVLKHDLYLMADEVYREFCYDGTKCISVMNLKGVEQNVVMIDSVSKRYSMCGVRLGTLVSRNRRIIDAALKMGYRTIVFLDDRAAGRCIGFPIAGPLDRAEALRDGKTDFVIALGDNRLRRRVAMGHDLPWARVVHPSAQISPFAELGAGTVVLAGAAVNVCARVGRHCIVNTGAVVEHDYVLEDFAQVAPRAALGGSVRVGALAQIGIGAVVKNNIAVGMGCVIGAGAVVVKSTEPGGVYVGVPAWRREKGAAV